MTNEFIYAATLHFTSHTVEGFMLSLFSIKSFAGIIFCVLNESFQRSVLIVSPPKDGHMNVKSFGSLNF